MKDINNTTISPDIPTPARLVSKDIIIREARLFEGSRIGYMCARTYYDSALSQFISPRKDVHYSDYERGFKQRAQSRLFEANNLTLVACEKSNPDLAIGQAQFFRHGNDAGYRSLLKTRNTYLLGVLAFFWVYWVRFITFINGGDKSADPEALQTFLKYGDAEEELHWKQRPIRWEARSVVVLEEFQGRGIGKMLMQKVIDMAEKERVVIGLHASKHGRYLYESVGFKAIAPFKFTVPGDEGGGVMLYTPKSLTQKNE